MTVALDKGGDDHVADLERFYSFLASVRS